MENKKFTQWCLDATKLIRYKPDRVTVQNELMMHLEDAYETNILNGLSPVEAEKKALASMGSAEEIAPELAKVHRPMLGYLYSVVKSAAIITTACAFAIMAIVVGGGLHTLITTRNFDSIPVNAGPLDHYSHPNVSDWSDGYHLQITEAGYRRFESTLHLQLEILYWPWMNDTDMARHLWAVDSLGNYYASYAEAQFTNCPRISFSGGQYTNCISITHMVITQFNCDAEWIELHYDRDGRDVVLCIDFTGGDGK